MRSPCAPWLRWHQGMRHGGPSPWGSPSRVATGWRCGAAALSAGTVALSSRVPIALTRKAHHARPRVGSATAPSAPRGSSCHELALRERTAAGFLSLCTLLTLGGNDGGAPRAVQCQTPTSLAIKDLSPFQSCMRTGHSGHSTTYHLLTVGCPTPAWPFHSSIPMPYPRLSSSYSDPHRLAHKAPQANASAVPEAWRSPA
jgi:hypothetical protein